MKGYHAIVSITRESIPLLIMIGLIPLVTSDYFLTGLYMFIIVAAFFIKRTKDDILVLAVGFIAMTIFESFFIATGVETFVRNSLFGMMPLWLPFLWAYGFVVIKRSLLIIQNQ